MRLYLLVWMVAAAVLALAGDAAAQRRGGRGPGRRMQACPQAPQEQRGPGAAQCPRQEPRPQRGQAGPIRGGPPATPPCQAATAPPPPAVGAAYLRRLQDALADEHAAQAHYRAAAAQFAVRRFAQLARAEQHHVAALTAAIQRYGGQPVPAPEPQPRPCATVAAADAVGAGLERHVIEVYDGLIADCPDPGLLPTLQAIQAANRRHLTVTSR